MKATNKDPRMDEFLAIMTGKDRRAVIASRECMTCDHTDVKFRDDGSRKEYTISGMCQPCQDDVFGIDAEEVEPWK